VGEVSKDGESSLNPNSLKNNLFIGKAGLAVVRRGIKYTKRYPDPSIDLY
jgi:hypothetical protein